MTTQDVLQRYSAGAKARDEALCCPVDYDRGLLELLPEEIVARDYGCGDPSRYVRAGDTVLDLGAGGGKICYMAAQLVGTDGRVIGVDMNDDMLALARRHRATMAERLGGDRVVFHKGRIQDLALDLADTEAWLAEHPVVDAAGLAALEAHQAHQRREAPLIPEASVDLVVSNCVLNLVAEHERRQMIAEIFRVLRPGGRVAISDIVADAPVPEALKRDSELWSGCIAGAFHERAFAEAFVAAGFTGVTYDKWQAEPWRVVEGIAFRPATLTADKPAAPAAAGGERTLVYRGPFAAVTDDRGRRFARGERVRLPGPDAAALLQGACAGHFAEVGEGGEQTAGGCC